MLVRVDIRTDARVRDDDAMTSGLFDDREVALLRGAVRGYTVDAVHDLIGPVGQSELARGDLAGVSRRLRGVIDPVATLVRLFLLGLTVPEPEARSALHPLPLDAARRAGLLTGAGSGVRALLDVRPYAQVGGAPAGPDWWVVSDFGSDVRPGPVAVDHVLGIGAASVTLAQATPRQPVERALDVGTGSGVQALHLGLHAREVVATDVSERALRLAATTAALSGQSWDLRAGSLLEPVAGERFDLVVANPPFVVSDGSAGYDYRDSGLAGDDVCAALVSGLPGILAEGGTAQLLANWIIPADRPWQDRLSGWFAGRGCDAWVWQREVAEPAEYVALWLRDAGEHPGSPTWAHRYDAWLDWLVGAGIAAIGMGLITLWRTDTADPTVVVEDVRQAVEQPSGAQIADWLPRQRLLAATSDEELLALRLRAADGLVLARSDVLGDGGWASAALRLRQSHGMRWEVETDDAVAALVAGCDGSVPLLGPVTVLAASLDRPIRDVAAALAPVVRDLIARGYLLTGSER
jgi:hypothetical protein